ncbi:MAG: hypothetical protein LUC92_08950 [Clostridiales bacterium]|nr:hypothetical protein [Clostridiales bacterium]
MSTPVIYSGLTTHAQREAFSRYVNSQITGAQSGLEYIVDSPQMDYLENQTLDFSADENNDYNTYFNNSADDICFEDTYKYRREYISAVDHTERKKVLDSYIAYTASATPDQQPGAWNNIDTTGLPTLFIPKPAAPEPVPVPAPVIQTPPAGGNDNPVDPAVIREKRKNTVQELQRDIGGKKLKDRSKDDKKGRLGGN